MDFAGSPGGLFGENGQDNSNGGTWTYFVDGQPDGFVHFVEWETPGDVTLGEVRVYALGDGDLYNNGREFAQFTLKAKSPGSDTYDVTVFTYTPTHPYSFIDPDNLLLIDQIITPLTAHSFRAEFTQYTAGNGWDGPRLIEMDGLPVPLPPPSSDDLWDISQGSVITASTPLIQGAGSLSGLFGEFGQNLSDGNTWTYFADGQPEGFVHAVEWQTQTNVTVGEVRLYAFGDSFLNNGREFAQFNLKAKSPGSDVFDLTLLTFTPTHPYTFLDSFSALILDETITPVTAQNFRAEFVQYTAGNSWDGPRIVELDALPAQAAPPTPPSDPPPADPPPSNPPPSDPPPSNPPPSDPPPVNPPPTEPPPSNPPPSDPPPANPPPSDPPPSNPPPSDPPPSDPPPSNPPPVEPPPVNPPPAEPPPNDPPPANPPPSDPPPVNPPPSDPPPTEPPPVTQPPPTPQPMPPAITANPQSQTVVKRSDAVFHVAATGENLHFQWKFNGRNISGATSDTLVIDTAKHPDNGSYTVVVWNDIGAVVSAPAALTVVNKNTTVMNYSTRRK